LPGWLQGVARRVALKARMKSVARTAEVPLPEESADTSNDPLARLTARELLTVLEEEVARLPKAQRSAVALCCLEGHTQEEAARMLGWTAGSLKGHLERGRKRLHDRLQRRGISLPAALALLAVSRGQAMSVLLLQNTVKAALNGSLGGSAAVLANSVLRIMLWGKLAGVLIVALTITLAASTTVALVYRKSTAEVPQEQTPFIRVVSKNANSGKPSVRTKPTSDPLPPHAVARLGSRRLYHGSAVKHVTLSPDGKYVVSTAWDGNRLWDASSGRQMQLREEFREAAIFPTHDKLIAVAKQNRDLQLWDVVSGKKIGGISPAVKLGQLPSALDFGDGPTSGRCPLRLSPDGRTLVICDLNERSVLRFCDVLRSQVEEPIPLKQDDGVQTQIAFSADSKSLIVQRIGKL
jgi:hypothetical protein